MRRICCEFGSALIRDISDKTIPGHESGERSCHREYEAKQEPSQGPFVSWKEYDQCSEQQYRTKKAGYDSQYDSTKFACWRCQESQCSRAQRSEDHSRRNHIVKGHQQKIADIVRRVGANARHLNQQEAAGESHNSRPYFEGSPKCLRASLGPVGRHGAMIVFPSSSVQAKRNSWRSVGNVHLDRSQRTECELYLSKPCTVGDPPGT